MIQFFIVGAQRSSTTWLYKMLNQHPQLKMASPIRPEPKYFLENNFENNEQKYLTKYFNNIEEQVIACGEKSTTYIESEIAASRISESFPNAKIIMLLRDPIERAISNYNFSVNNGIENRSISDAILGLLPPPALDKEFSTDPFNYLGRGLYENYIQLYKKYFLKENILILSKELITNDIDYLKTTYRFIGVEPTFTPSDFAKTENASIELESVPEEVRSYLKHYYTGTYEYLSEYFDTNCWDPSR